MTVNPYLVGVINIPSGLEITAITKTCPMVITITVNVEKAANTYIPGQRLRLDIPHGYGMQQANGLTVCITSVSGNNISVDVDARSFDTFSVPVSGAMPASISPSGSRNLAFSNSTTQIAFQSLNNIGN